jgi:peptide-methionine (S)-S-oxide reductase
VIRTRVGYAGGTTADPTYRSLGDHSEAIQIDYDPNQISFEELLDLFWESHNPTSRPFSQQYASLILYHDEEQERAAVQSRDQKAARLGGQIFTEIRPLTRFYLAEDYHQKYWLRQNSRLMEAFNAIYPGAADFVNSTAIARANGYAGGNLTLTDLVVILDELDLPPEQRQKLEEAISN